MNGCPDCFKEQRSRNDQLIQIKDEAQRFSNKENCKVAVLSEGQGFIFQKFSGEIPEGTIDIIFPVQ